MDGDSGSRLPRVEHRALWRLPEIEELTIRRVHYRVPRKHVVAGEVREFKDRIEILVQTGDEIPVRALSPALFIGTTEIAENEQVSPREYRFFVLDERGLRPGAPIRLGWVGSPPDTKSSRFRYQVPSDR